MNEKELLTKLIKNKCKCVIEWNGEFFTGFSTRKFGTLNSALKMDAYTAFGILRNVRKFYVSARVLPLKDDNTPDYLYNGE